MVRLESSREYSLLLLNNFIISIFVTFLFHKHLEISGGSPGLVGMGDDSYWKGRGFESRHRILDGLTFFTFI